MTEPNAAPLVAPAAPAVAPASTPAPTQVAPESPWTKLTDGLRIDDETVYPTPDLAVESFRDARRQIKDHKALVDRFSGYIIKYEDGREVSASEDPEAFFSLVGTLLAQQGAAARGAAAQPALGDEKLDPSKLTPEWQSAISTLRRTGQFAAADELQKMAEKVTALEQQVQGVTQAQSDGVKARVEATQQHAKSLLAAVISEAGLPKNDKFLTSVYNSIEEEVVLQSRDKADKVIPGSLEDRFMRGDEAARKSILSELAKPYLGVFDEFAKSKNASFAADKTRLMAGQPKPLGSPGTGALAPQKRPTESERMETLRGILSQSA